MNNKAKLLVMIGVGDDRKPRAARFGANDELAARKASGLMNFRIGIAKAEQAMALASKLPEGKIYESGLGLVPLVQEQTFTKLVQLLTFDPSWAATGFVQSRPVQTEEAIVAAADLLWGAICVGSTVLAFDVADPTLFGWSAAVVVSASKNGDTLQLRWRDWPNFKTFMASRRSVATWRPDVTS